MKNILLLLLLLWAAVGPAQVPPAIPVPPAPGVRPATNAAPVRPGDDELVPELTLRFQEADFYQVLDVYARLVGRTIIRPASLPSPKITIRAQTPLTRREAIQALDTVFALNGIATSPQGDKFMKVIPFGDVPGIGAPRNETSLTNLEETARYITRVVQLKYADPVEVQAIITPFAKLPGSVIAIKSSQMIVIRDYMENVKRMLEMIELVDVAVPVNYEPIVIPIKYALVGDIASVLSSVTAGGSSTSVGQTGRSGLTPGTGGTGLGTGGGINRNPLTGQPNNPNATGLGGAGAAARSPFANTIQRIVNRAAAGAGGEIQVLGQSKIIADERTNSLLIFADKNDMAMISNIIAKIDVVLAQVLIETLIYEVSLNDDLKYGVSASQNNKDIGKFSGAGVANNGPGYLNPKGLKSLNNFTNVGAGFSYFGKFGGDFDVAVQAAATDSRIKVLSNPSILTSHAKQAEFFVGETRPYVIGTSYNGFNGGGAQSQYQQTQIGIRLSVLPLINSEGLVVMDIKQSIQQVGDTVKIDNNDVPTTVDREASAYIAVHDRDTVMLGGFISSNKRDSKGGVPLLKDIPILGGLFRNTSSSKGRTELVVMMRPTVMQTPEIAALSTSETIENRLPGVRRAIRDNENMVEEEQRRTKKEMAEEDKQKAKRDLIDEEIRRLKLEKEMLKP